MFRPPFPAACWRFLAQLQLDNTCASAPSESVNIGGVASQECKLIAPTMPTNVFALSNNQRIQNANQIDTVQSCTESIFFVAAGCNLQFTTDAIAISLGGRSWPVLSPNAQIDVTDGNTAGIAFYAGPGSLTLLAMGLAGLPSCAANWLVNSIRLRSTYQS